MSKLLKTLIWSFLTAILGTHILAMFFNWYWKFMGLDVILHFFGGVWVALIFLWFTERFPYYANFKNNIAVLFIAALSFTALIGVGWEFFEFFFDLVIGAPLELPSAQLGLRDTLSDLVFDLLGAAMVMLGLFFIKRNQKTDEVLN